MQILKEGARLYFRHLAVLTRPLLYPLFAQLFGILFWIVLAYESMDLLTLYFPQMNLWLMWGIFALANLPGMYIFLNGFWHYIVWVSGLNLIIRELTDSDTCHESLIYVMRITSRSADYSLIWLFLFAIMFIPFGLAVLPLAMAAPHSEWLIPSLWLSASIVFIGLILACLLLIFFSLVFQVFAYTPGSAGASLFRSMDLVGQDVLKCLIVIVASVGMTQFALPTAITWACDATHLTQTLAGSVEGAVTYVLARANEDALSLKPQYPYLASILHILSTNPAAFTQEIIRTLIFTFVSALLLPLGSCWFALLYADLKTRLEVSPRPPSIRETAEVAV